MMDLTRGLVILLGLAALVSYRLAPVASTTWMTPATTRTTTFKESRRAPTPTLPASRVLSSSAGQSCAPADVNLADEFAAAVNGQIPHDKLILFTVDATPNVTDSIAALRDLLNGSPARLALLGQIRNQVLVDVFNNSDSLDGPGIRIFLESDVAVKSGALELQVYVAEFDGEVQQDATAIIDALDADATSELEERWGRALDDVVQGCAGQAVEFAASFRTEAVLVQRPSFRYAVLAVMLTATSALCLVYCARSVSELRATYRSNKEFRAKRKAADNPRIQFGRNGQVMLACAFTGSKLSQLDRILRVLRCLADKHMFGDMALLRYNRALGEARAVVLTCAPAARTYLSLQAGDQQLTNAFQPMDELLTSLDNRQEPVGTPMQILSTINGFKEELLVLHAAFGKNSGPAQEVMLKVLSGAGSKMGLNNSIEKLAARAEKLKAGFFEAHGKELLEASTNNGLEPRGVVEGIYVRRSGWLSLYDKFRERYGLGTRGLLLKVVAIVVTMGMLRFNTFVGAILLSTVAGVALWLQVTVVAEDLALFGFRRSFRQQQGFSNLLLVAILAITLGVFVGLALNGAQDLAMVNDLVSCYPETTEQLRGFNTIVGPIEVPPEFGPPIDTRRTFLDVPAQYKLEEVQGQDVYLSIIFGIMHGNLLVLFLLPLPICYATQSYLVHLFPVARHFMPQHPVGLHRLLGQLLLGGLCLAGMIWIAGQGHACFISEVSIVDVGGGSHTPRACLAFDPANDAGKDVFMLRFEIVWPLGFFFVPLMIWSKCPLATGEGKKRSSAKKCPITGRTEEPSLNVVIEGARSLRRSPQGPGGISTWFAARWRDLDPYCTCEVAGRQFTTNSEMTTSEPVWNWKVKVENYQLGEPLDFRVFDKDWGVGDVLLGGASLEASAFLREGGFHGELVLEGDAGRACGSLHVHVVPDGNWCPGRVVAPRAGSMWRRALESKATMPVLLHSRTQEAPKAAGGLPRSRTQGAPADGCDEAPPAPLHPLWHPWGLVEKALGLDGARPGAPAPGLSDSGVGDDVVAGVVEAATATASELTPRRPRCLALRTFLWRLVGTGVSRSIDALLITIVVMGLLISSVSEYSLPFWHIIAAVLLLHYTLRGLELVQACSVADRAGMWAAFLRASWWEVAYWCHVVAGYITLSAALLLRLQVFYPVLLSWVVYFIDRLYGIACSYAYRAPIVLDGRTASYTVTGTNGAPSYVRLVLRKPRNFTYRPGQWCHLALQSAGSYCGLPSFLKPFLQWHSFSMACAPHDVDDDFLEFHIGVQSGRGAELADPMNVVASQAGLGRKLKLHSNFVERLCPHRVPAIGEVPKDSLGKTCKVSESGIYYTLAPGDGSGTIMALKPQEQWTGRLWNIVHSLLDSRFRGHCLEHQVSIMGPYGNLANTALNHPALMLIGAGVGFPASGSILQYCLDRNLHKRASKQQAVCFLWSASKVDQLLLCFPTLLTDLTRYVHRRGAGKPKRGLKNLMSWLTIKIFVSNFEAGDFLSCAPNMPVLTEDGDEMSASLSLVQGWLLGSAADSEHVPARGQSGFLTARGMLKKRAEEEGDSRAKDTYVAQGSLSVCFGDILRCSNFTKEKVMKAPNSLGICFCGPMELRNRIESDVNTTVFPKQVEFVSEATK